MPRQISSIFTCLLASAVFAADGPTIIDGAGKEITPKTWKITAGTKKLDWVSGSPNVLVFRETNSTGFRDGVLTFIPLERLESLTYDVEKQSVKANVAGIEQPLEGSIRYQGINQIVIEAEMDKGEAGTVELKYKGGSLKGGIKGVKFPNAKAGAAPTGDKLFVTIVDGKKSEGTRAVHQLQALYRIEKGEKTQSWVMFKKTFKVELTKIKKLSFHEQADQKEFECVVVLDDGSEQTLTLLTTVMVEGKAATLEGLVGVVPAGWKLFPIHTVGEVSKDEPKGDAEKLGPKKKDK